MPGANWTGGGRTAARIQSKAKVTRAHFGKQRLIQRNIGRYEPKAQLTAISLAHATAKPTEPASPSTNPSPSSTKLTDSSNVTKAFHPSPPRHEDARKRKLYLFRALDEGNPAAFEIKRQRLLAASNLAGLPETTRNCGPPSQVGSNEHASCQSHTNPGSFDSSEVVGISDQPLHQDGLQCPSPRSKLLFRACLSPQYAYYQSTSACTDVTDCETSARTTSEGLICSPSQSLSLSAQYPTLASVVGDDGQFSSAWGAQIVERPYSIASTINSDHSIESASCTRADAYTSTGDDLRIAWQSLVRDAYISPSNLPPPSPHEALEWLTAVPENAGVDFRVQTTMQTPTPELDAGGVSPCDSSIATVQGPLDSEIVTAPETHLAQQSYIGFLAHSLLAPDDEVARDQDACVMPINDLDIPLPLDHSEETGLMHKDGQGGLDNRFPTIPNIFRTPSPFRDLLYQDTSEQQQPHFRDEHHTFWSPEPSVESGFHILGQENGCSEPPMSAVRQGSEGVGGEPALVALNNTQINNIIPAKHFTQRDISADGKAAMGVSEDENPPSIYYSAVTTSLDTPKRSPVNEPSQVDVDDDPPPGSATPSLRDVNHPPLAPTVSDSIDDDPVIPVLEGGNENDLHNGAYDAVVSVGSGRILGPILFCGDQDESDEDS